MQLGYMGKAFTMHAPIFDSYLTSDWMNSLEKLCSTALGWASLKNHVECARLLLAHPDVDVNHRAKVWKNAC